MTGREIAIRAAVTTAIRATFDTKNDGRTASDLRDDLARAITDAVARFPSESQELVNLAASVCGALDHMLDTFCEYGFLIDGVNRCFACRAAEGRGHAKDCVSGNAIKRARYALTAYEVFVDHLATIKADHIRCAAPSPLGVDACRRPLGHSGEHCAVSDDA